MLNGNFQPGCQTCDPCQHLVKIDHCVGGALFNASGDGRDALLPTHPFFRGGIDKDRLGDFPFFSAFSIVQHGRIEGTEATTDLFFKKRGQGAVRVFTDQHFRYFVPVPAEHLRQCNGLGQVPAALSLDNEQVLHAGNSCFLCMGGVVGRASECSLPARWISQFPSKSSVSAESDSIQSPELR